MRDLAAIQPRFVTPRAVLGERSRRLAGAPESVAIGRAGISVLWPATGAGAVGGAGHPRRPRIALALDLARPQHEQLILW